MNGTNDIILQPNSARQIFKYALVIVLYVCGCPLHMIRSLDIAPASSARTSLFRYWIRKVFGAPWIVFYNAS